MFEQGFDQSQTEDIQIIENSDKKSNGIDTKENETKMDTTNKDDINKMDVDQSVYPGKIFIDYAKTSIEINKDHDVTTLSVTNLSDEPISVGSHYHFIEVNKSLKFDRSIAFGMRLVISAFFSVLIN